jgi:hypothetical protein
MKYLRKQKSYELLGQYRMYKVQVILTDLPSEGAVSQEKYTH